LLIFYEMSKLSARVLVLNRFWQVVNICTVKRAFSLLFQDSARAVVLDGGGFQTFDFQGWINYSQNNFYSTKEAKEKKEWIRTVKYSLRIPWIILLVHYEGYPRLKVSLTRRNVYKRDNFTCQYCGKKFQPKYLNIDHVIPKHRGGKTTWDNVVCSCIWCNLKKGGKTLEEAGMRLLKKPSAPVKFPIHQEDLIKFFHPSWKHFIDLSYWKVKVGEEDASL